jgi:CRP-like cAMP-binding protein
VVPLAATTDLQLLASVLGIATLNLAFALQLGRTYDAWLARAFPHLPERVLIAATNKLQEVRLRAGERIQPTTEHLYIVTSGSGSLVRPGPGGHEILLRVLAPGTIVKDLATVKAETTLELLAVPVKSI